MGGHQLVPVKKFCKKVRMWAKIEIGGWDHNGTAGLEKEADPMRKVEVGS